MNFLRTINFSRLSIMWQLVLPIPVLLAVAALVVWLVLPGYVANSAQSDAVRNATQTVGQFTKLRSYYTKNIVKKVLKNGGKASFNHASEPDSIPLPATVIHDMSALLSEEDVSLQLFSAYPFPNRADRQLDAFQQEAWDFLVANPDEIFTRRETLNGKEVVRVAVADRMVADGCVNCHNSRADTPKDDWKLGDVRGILQVDAVIDGQLAAGAALSNRIILFGVLGGFLLIGVVVLLGRGIIGPIKTMTGAMERLAAGDKDIDVPARERQDEVGAMAAAVEVFKENAIETEKLETEKRVEEARSEQRRKEREAEQEKRAQRAQEIQEACNTFDQSVSGVIETVSSASTELQTTAETMSTTAEQTTQRATTVAAASEEASTNVQTVASAAEEMSSSIDEIGRKVTQSTEIASKAVSEAQRTNETVQGLAEAAQKIGEVVNLISDIAEQTNLLALNATIEAARAGDAGKGFAVVASEVKSLANQTAKATEEIASQIGSMQSVTGEAVDAIKGIGGTIEQVSEIATTISAAVEEQGAATQEIARNVQEASKGTSEVSSNITGVNQAATETGAAAKQMLDATGQLSREAETLKSEVAKFLTEIRAA